MDSSFTMKAVFLASIILGVIKFGSLNSKGWKWQLKIVEMWNDFVNFFISGLIGYYFVIIRLPLLLMGETLEISDFALFIIFMLGLFGHLCVMSLNITKGIEAILSRVLETNRSTKT